MAEAVQPAAADQRPGVWLTISGGALPEPAPGAPLPLMTLAEYHDAIARARGYEPAKPVVKDSDPDKWAKFPGEGLDYTSVRDIDHTGGPR